MKKKVIIQKPHMRLVGRKYTKDVHGVKNGVTKFNRMGYVLAIGSSRVALCSDAVSLIGLALDEHESAPIKKITIHFGCEDSPKEKSNG